MEKERSTEVRLWCNRKALYSGSKTGTGLLVIAYLADLPERDKMPKG